MREFGRAIARPIVWACLLCFTEEDSQPGDFLDIRDTMNIFETDQSSDLQQENSAVASETPEGDLPDNHDARSKLKLLRLRNVGGVIIGYLNINSIRNKFDALRDIITANTDILMVAETKIDSSFLRGQFLIDRFAAPYRLDKNKDGGGLLVYVRSNIPSPLLTSFKCGMV